MVVSLCYVVARDEGGAVEGKAGDGVALGEFASDRSRFSCVPWVFLSPHCLKLHSLC